ncbi:MAG: hypothetical protein HQK76_13830 [Desulfobacterales bacterium]|nr:hypothetical protein [Desulfobacterales bacterium]
MDKMNMISKIENSLLSQGIKKKSSCIIFKDTLNKAMEQTKEAEVARDNFFSLKGIMPTKSINIEMGYPNNTVVDSTFNLLSLLDEYGRNLGDTNKSLREIEPLINTINKEASSLLKKADEQNDENLKNIINNCALRANVEFIKFQRGDYI